MKVKCSRCNGTGVEEETIKGYRRYVCSLCNGEREYLSPFATEDDDDDAKKNANNTTAVHYNKGTGSTPQIKEEDEEKIQ